MRIGAMNHPARDPLAEIAWIAELGLEFVDLTLEPPAAAPWTINLLAVREAAERTRLALVGHTAYYLPVGHPFEMVRQAATASLIHCMQQFAQLGVRWMNVHPDGYAPMHDRGFVIEQNLKSLSELIAAGQGLGVGVMLENIPHGFNTADQLAELLDPLPQLGLHLDLGHANIRVSENTTESILARFGDRLRHVHLHDNHGDADSHLPLGAGSLNLPRIISALRDTSYDDTITLEVFARDRHYLSHSRDVLRQLWDDAR